jgi:Type IV secretion system pilin
MKKLFTILTAGLVTALVLATPALAAGQPFTGACSVTGAGVRDASRVCKADGSDPLTGPNGTLTKVAGALGFVAGIVAVIFVIVGGIKYIFSGGDSSATSSAKNTILYALVGLVVAVLAREIIMFVLGKV